jgi:hypothetical protein
MMAHYLDFQHEIKMHCLFTFSPENSTFYGKEMKAK